MRSIEGIAHIALKIKDAERSLAFYRDGLEFPEMFRLNHPDGRLWLVYLKITDTQYLEIFPEAAENTAPPPGTNGIDHLCLQVKGIDDLVKRIAAKGIDICRWGKGPAGDSQLIAAGADAVTLGLDGNKQAWLKDPDGIRIELMEMLPGSLQDRAVARLSSAR